MSDKIEIHDHKDWDIAFHFFRLGRFEDREGTFERHFQDYLNEINKDIDTCKHLKTYQKIRFGKTLTKCSDCRIILSIGSTVTSQ